MDVGTAMPDAGANLALGMARAAVAVPDGMGRLATQADFRA
jgi:hypothetical protein